jgi:AraC-like DNA-binding protein
MKPQLLKVSSSPTQSFSVHHHLVPNVNNRWHYHPEVELIYFVEGSGTQFVGDCINRFQTGDLVLIGSQLPHFWRWDDKYFEEGLVEKADVKVAHFNENFWGDQFLNLPENRVIKSVLERAKRGIKITGGSNITVSKLLDKLLKAEGPERILLLMQALIEIANCEEIITLSSMGFKQDFEEADRNRINDIYDYTITNFQRKIHLEEIALIAKVSPNSFCRYFKSRTRKTYSQFLTEIKVGNACKLLIENRLSIKQICYDSGFNNLASFHKYFKIITGKSPLVYQKDFLKVTPFKEKSA